MHSVSIYDEPGREPEITCQECLDWLNGSLPFMNGRPNRILVTKGGVEKWLGSALEEENDTPS